MLTFSINRAGTGLPARDRARLEAAKDELRRAFGRTDCGSLAAIPIVFPDGSLIQLDNLPATDAAGHVGLRDRVAFHIWRLLRGIGLSTLLGVGTQLGLCSSASDLVRAIRESVQSNGDRAGQRIVERNLDIQPTIRVRPGFPLRVMVHKDLVLRSRRG